MGDLSFYRLKKRDDKLVQIEFNESCNRKLGIPRIRKIRFPRLDDLNYVI